MKPALIVPKATPTGGFTTESQRKAKCFSRYLCGSVVKKTQLRNSDFLRKIAMRAAASRPVRDAATVRPHSYLPAGSVRLSNQILSGRFAFERARTRGCTGIGNSSGHGRQPRDRGGHSTAGGGSRVCGRGELHDRRSGGGRCREGDS